MPDGGSSILSHGGHGESSYYNMEPIFYDDSNGGYRHMVYGTRTKESKLNGNSFF